MISICIPVYNFDIRPLLFSLLKQMEGDNDHIEIILIDDASEESYRKGNRISNKAVKYIQLEKNIGRSAIRNLFLKYANNDYLLFLDCDSLMVSDNFVHNYHEIIEKHDPEVVCGGRVYPSEYPGRKKRLRWKYGILRESKDANQRNKNPYRSFMTNNFVIEKSLFEETRFDERIAEYGHEDTLLGYQFKKKDINLVHIENPVLNGDIEDNSLFLDKTKSAVQNLQRIFFMYEENSELMEDITLLKAYKRLRKQKIDGAFALIYRLKRPIVIWLLKKGFANMSLFGFYKMGEFLLGLRLAKK